MKFKATYLPAILLLLLFAGNSSGLCAQGILGITWEVPEDTIKVNQQLDAFSQLGISYLEIDHPVDPQILSLAEEANFTVLVRSNKSYLTISDFKSQQNELLEDFLAISDRYRSYFHVAGIGLLSHSQTRHSDFETVFSPVIDSLKAQSNKSFYFYSNNNWYNFESPTRPFGKYYYSNEFQIWDLSTLQSTFDQEISGSPNLIHFFSSSWLLEAIENYPPITKSLQNYTDSGQWIMPQPKIPGEPVSARWVVLLLFMLWIALAIQIKYLPYVRPMIIRWFLSHRFFVEDIQQYRERASSGGILMMILHSIFGGLVFYLSSRILISEAGLQALFHHLPYLAITGINYISLFFFGVIVLLITQLLTIFWLHLPAKTLDHFSQTINLYAGAFYSDFIIVTVMVTLFAAETGSSVILILAGFYLLIWYISFIGAAYDSSHKMGPNRIFYLLFTIGLYIILSIAALILLLTNVEFIQIIDLAISL
ncbi:MAG: hypothetical protein WD361_10030 [Gracilimonas sp.]